MSASKVEKGVLLGGGARDFTRGCGGAGAVCVVALVGGTGGQVGASARRVVVPARGPGGRVRAGAWEGGAADTLCDRSQMEALIGASLLSRATEVGRVATIDCTVPNWVAMVSS